jgi:hypothetical protein
MIASMLLTLAAGAALAQPATSPQPAVRVVRRAAPPPPIVTGDHAVVPLTFVAGFPTLSATIGGKPVKLGFDTGAAGGARLTDRVVQALNLQPVGEALAADPSGKNPVRLKLYPVEDLALGSLNITRWIATSAPVRPGKLETLDGIIGLGAFDGFIVTLDYPGARLLLERGALPEADGKTVFTYKDPIPVVPLTIEGKAIEAHLDTGNIRMPVIVPEAFAARLSRNAEARPAGLAHTVSNTIAMKAMPVTGTIAVGQVPLAVTEVGFPSVIDLANLGSLALTNMTIRVDPRNKRVQIVRSTGSVT